MRARCADDHESAHAHIASGLVRGIPLLAEWVGRGRIRGEIACHRIGFAPIQTFPRRLAAAHHVRLAIASRRTQRHDDACAMPYAAAANLQERAYSPGPAWVRGRCGRLCSGRKTLFAYSTGDASSWIASNDFRGR